MLMLLKFFVYAVEVKNNMDARDKWDQALDYSGFQIIPNLLLAQQKNLGVSPTALVVLLHINRFWWKRDQNPFPSSALIAKQMGLHLRSVERHLQHLEEKGLILRLASRRISGKVVRPISLIPLVERLNRIAEQLEIKREGMQAVEKVQSDGSQGANQDGTSSKQVPF